MREWAMDLSIANRLVIGSLIVLTILGAGLTFVLSRQARSSDLQQEFATRIAPRTTVLHALEESVLSLAIAVRSYLLNPEPARLQQYQQAAVRVREVLERVSDAMADTAASAGMSDLQTGVQRYLFVVERAAARGAAAGGLDQAQEVEMRAVRLEVQGALRRAVSAQQSEGDVALAAMSDARRDVWVALAVMAGGLALCLVVFTWVTARSITEPVNRLVRVAAALESGDWRPSLALRPAPGAPHAPARRRDEMSTLARAFGAAAEALERRTQRLGADRDVATAAASTLDKRVLGERALRVMAGYVGADIGAVYWREAGSDVLAPLAQQALHDNLPPVRVGEGLLGQAAREQRMVVLRDIPRDSPFIVRLGIDQLPPAMLVAVPLAVRGDVHGIALFGALKPLDDEALEFLDAVGGQLGVGLQNVAAHEEIERLLGELRESNQELQAQSEELQAQNEEMHAQNELLQVQSEELHAQHEEIQHRSALLEEQDERKNEFLGVLAHELRNPLAPMVTSLYLLKRSSPDSDVARRAQDVIARQVTHLSRLTDDLLDVTRISRGKITLQRTRLDMADVVRDCVEDQRGTFDGRDLRIELVAPEAPLWVHGDRTRLCQVLSNLLSNAAKFSTHGGTIGISLHADADEVILEVIDHGCGIESTLLPQIFQPFIQGPTGASTAGGLGLGLALVKALVELHGGTVTAFSEGVDRGARFVVRLPRDHSTADDLPAPVGTTSVTPKRILLIEDNVDAAVTLDAALSLEGHVVEMAHNGVDGVALAETFRPDVVLCDLGLPDIDGYTVARRLRDNPQLRTPLLIAVTGYAAERDRHKARASGFDHHLAKPVTVERLTEVLSTSDGADA